MDRKRDRAYNQRVIVTPAGTTSNPEVTLNEYCINIGGSLAEQIAEAPLFDVYLNNPSETAFSFQPVSEEMISNIIKKMKNKCSYGHDLLSNIMIKKAHDLL